MTKSLSVFSSCIRWSEGTWLCQQAWLRLDFSCFREQNLKLRTSLLQGLCLASTGIREQGKKGRRMKTVVHQYRGFHQINLFPGISTGKDSSKPGRNPESAFTCSREVGANLVPQNKTRKQQCSFWFGLI